MIQLKYLDLSGNFINKADDDSLGSLKNLETLVIGEHNYFNETLEAEIGKLKALKVWAFLLTVAMNSDSNLFGLLCRKSIWTNLLPINFSARDF